MGTIVTNTYKSLGNHGDIVTQLSSDNVTENSLENGPKKVERDETGKLLPGHSGLPGAGRPPEQHISEAYRHILRRDGPLKYAEVIAQDALTAPRASDRREAISEMTDRTEGKAVQSVRMAGVFMIAAPGEDVLNAAFGAVAPAEDE